MKLQLLAAIAAITLLAACHPDTSVDPQNSTARVSSSTSDSTHHHGGPHGTKPTSTTITQDKLPQTVLTYLTTNYAGYTFVSAAQAADSTGKVLGYSVSITQNSTNYHLHFDATGTVVTKPEGNKGGSHGTKPASTSITQDKLPQTVLTYLTSTYAGYTFVGASQSADSTGKILGYSVAITQNSTAYHLHFDATGAVVTKPEGHKDGKGGPGPKGTEITQDKLPATALSYLTTTYAGYTFNKAFQATNRDGNTVYAVSITQSGTKYLVLFDATGAFVSVKKG